MGCPMNSDVRFNENSNDDDDDDDAQAGLNKALFSDQISYSDYLQVYIN